MRSRKLVTVPAGEHTVPNPQPPPHTPTHKSTTYSDVTMVPPLTQKKPRSSPELGILHSSHTAAATFEPRCLSLEARGSH